MKTVTMPVLQRGRRDQTAQSRLGGILGPGVNVNQERHHDRSPVRKTGVSRIPGHRMEKSCVSHVPAGYSNSMITSSTASDAPGAALILRTTAFFSARRTFSIFIASTVASA